MTTQDILKQCTVDGTIVRLPQIKLERKEYLEVKNKLELIGGAWKGGKTQGFVFEEDPTELLEDLRNGDDRNLKKEYQFFATPPEMADRIVKEATPYLSGDDTKILEPSAGDGALIKAFRKMSGFPYVIDCYEAMELNQKKLAKLENVALLGDDFLQCDRANYYDHIFANPPFTKNQDIDHIYKMYEVLKPGGTMATLASGSWLTGSQKKQVEFREWLEEVGATYTAYSPGEFKSSGTMTGGMFISIEKIQKCRVCGCTDRDCRQCIEKTGGPCSWVLPDLCSACVVDESKEEVFTKNSEREMSAEEIADMTRERTDARNPNEIIKEIIETNGLRLAVRWRLELQNFQTSTEDE